MLELKNIVKKYIIKKNNDVVALNDINLKLDDHGMVFILGKSGSGKSTLLNVMGGLDTFDSGEIIICGKSSNKFKQVDFDSYRNTYIGFIFQEYNMLDNMTVGKNIALALELQGKKNNGELVKDILDEVGLAGFEDRKTSELSGGQKQRVAIARALIKNPKIIMADEPTGALDSSTGKQIMDMLKKLSEDKLVIVVSHDREFAEEYADRIIELSDGRIISDSDDSVYEGGEEHFSLIKSKLPFLNSLKMALGSFKTKPFRLAVAIILSVASFTLFGLASVFTSYDSKDALIESIDDGGTEYLSVKYETKGTGEYSYYHEELLSEEEASLLENKFSDIHFYKPYSEDKNTGTFSYALNHGPTYSIEEGTDSPAFFNSTMSGLLYLTDNDINSLDFKITGSLPKKDNEIAITEYQYEHFLNFGYVEDSEKNSNPVDIKSHEDLIGKTISITINNAEMKFTITGIVDTGLDDSRYSCFKEDKEYDGISEYLLYNEMSYVINYSFHNVGCISEDLYNKLVKEIKPASANDEENNYSVINGDYFYSVDNFYEYQDSFKDSTVYFDGNAAALQKGEAILTYDSVKEVVVKTEDGEMTIMDLVNEEAGDNADSASLKKACEKVLKEYATTIENGKNVISIYGELTNYENKNASLKIVGVYIPEDEDYSCVTYMGFMVLSKEDMSTYKLKPRGNYSFILSDVPSDKSVIGDIIDYSNDNGVENTQFVMVDAVSYIIDQADDFIRPASDKFLYVGLGFAVFATVMLSNFISVSIYSRKKQIGILRALGARSKDVFMIFCNESMVIGLINWLLSSTVTIIAVQIINNVLSNKYGLTVTLMSFKFIHLILLLVISIAIAFIASFIPVYRTSKKKPIDAIRK